jgi:predicted AlkP superfamily pyrophosphatase or phosphodiesterase
MTFLSCRQALPLLLAAAAACGRQAVQSNPASRPRPTVVVVSFDALGNRFLDRDTLPAFHRMMREGVRAPFRPEFPSKTFPNHYSMATGLPPGQHGLVLNQFYDPVWREWFLHASQNDGRWFGGEPIWVAAERAGLRTAAYFWMGSEAEIAGARPTYAFPFDATVADSTKLAQIMRWLRLPDEQRPRLVMMYSNVVDVAGHRAGPDAPQTYDAVRTADRFLGAMRDSLAALGRGDIDLIVVSDHGLSSVPREHDIDMDTLVPPRGVLVDDEHATFSIWQDPAGPTVDLDSLAAFYRRTIPHMRLFRPGEFPAKWQTQQNRRFGDLFLLADPGWEFVGTKPRALYTLGEHGYDPETPDMMGVFLAVGPDFQSGVRLEARENRTLHDLLARLLALPVARTTTTTAFGIKGD